MSKNERSKSSASWLNEHVNDHYVHLAQKEGYRARSAYKLLEINEKDKLLHPNMTVVDLGSAPGSWSQVVAKQLNGTGKIVALDILPMEEIPDVIFIQDDFTSDNILLKLNNALENRPVDLVICDIAPNMSGNNVTDQARSFYLAELALDFAQNYLQKEGSFLVKVFQGAGFQEYLSQMRQTFVQTLTRKPKASRDRSNEIYLLGKKLK